jgi:hypothetical protein
MMEMRIQANVALFVADFVAGSVSDNLANVRDRFERLPVTPQNSAGFGGSTALHACDKRRVRYSPIKAFSALLTHSKISSDVLRFEKDRYSLRVRPAWLMSQP